MNNRELATFILLGILLGVILVKGDLRSSLGDVLKVMLSPKLGVPLLIFIGWTGLAVWLARSVGLWTWDLTASTALWFLFIGMAWFINLGNAGKDPDFFKKRVIETLSIGAVFEFFINLKVMALPLELLLLVLVAFLVILDAFARHYEEHKPVARLTTGLLAVIGLGVTAFTIRQVVRDWQTLTLQEVVSQLVLPVWLTVAAVPCIYLIALYSGYESLFGHLKFRNESRRPAMLALAGVITALKGSLLDINGFRGVFAKQAATTRSFREARRAVHDFKRERARDRAARAHARQRLLAYAGAPGVDDDGLRLDRREFAETKRALDWIATCHMGQYQREDRPNSYRRDLLDLFEDFDREGLPKDHGIVMEVRKDGQAWYAYRATPSGHVFGIGAEGPPPSQWFYDGTEPPQSFPTKKGGWTSFMDPDRPEWQEEPPTD